MFPKHTLKVSFSTQYQYLQENAKKKTYILVCHTMSCFEHPSFVDDGGSTVSVSTGTKDPPSRTELAVQIGQPRPLTDVLYSLASNKSPATGKLLGMFLVAILCSKAKQAIKDT